MYAPYLSAVWTENTAVIRRQYLILVDNVAVAAYYYYYTGVSDVYRNIHTLYKHARLRGRKR